MNLVKKYWHYIVIVLLLIFWFQSCENYKADISDLKVEMSLDSLDFENRKTKDGKLISSQEIKIVSDKNTMKRLVKEVNGLRNINRQIKATIHTELTNVLATPLDNKPTIIHDTTYVDSSVSVGSFMKLPQSYKVDNEWLGIYYTIDTSGNSKIDTALFVTKPIISFGYKDEGFIKNLVKKDIALVTYEDQNPYSTVKGLQNLEYKPNKKWYEKKLVWLGAGFLTGIIIVK